MGGPDDIIVYASLSPARQCIWMTFPRSKKFWVAICTLIGVFGPLALYHVTVLYLT